jgi:hypothetical protein
LPPVEASTGAAKPSSTATIASAGAFCMTASSAPSTETASMNPKPTAGGSSSYIFMAANDVR